MVELSIIRTAKPYGNKSDYEIYDDSTKYFQDIAEAKQWLGNEFGNCKRQPSYVDKKDGSVQRIGYVYGFKNDFEKVYEQAWVRFFKVTPLTV